MGKVAIRVLTILFVAFIVAGLDGMSRGMEMPPEVDTSKVPQVRKTNSATDMAEEAEVVELDEDVAEKDTDEAEGSSSQDENGESENEFTAELLYDLLYSGSALLIDARVAEEFAEGHIPTAIHLPIEKFDEGIPEAVHLLLDVQSTDPEMQFVIYCGGGECHASNVVGAKLQQYGLENVFVFEGGYPAWQQAGYEIEQGEPNN